MPTGEILDCEIDIDRRRCSIYATTIQLPDTLADRRSSAREALPRKAFQRLPALSDRDRPVLHSCFRLDLRQDLDPRRIEVTHDLLGHHRRCHRRRSRCKFHPAVLIPSIAGGLAGTWDHPDPSLEHYARSVDPPDILEICSHR